MAAVHAPCCTSAMSQDDRGALVKERQEGGDRLPQFRIQSECALTNMNAPSGKNLTSRVLPDEVGAGASQDTYGALRSVTDKARLRRTTATCIWGVSDPRNWGSGP